MILDCLDLCKSKLKYRKLEQKLKKLNKELEYLTSKKRESANVAIGNSCFYDETKQYIPNYQTQKFQVEDNQSCQTSKGYTRTLGNYKYPYYEKRGVKNEY